ncbi:type II asparaginase [Paenibacillus sp. J5C_2022]|uniref:type II asparaginase n=1 Tax=Paenibacillus sp. J5C2022 TaxID=2977129 RepID=UPI0021D3161B|nr:type II asparaginase [Paenibacillus sp. J5C2022]MCU6709762.1 type II asparaginase [Paenibacillus sp. J5C2022]
MYIKRKVISLVTAGTLLAATVFAGSGSAAVITSSTTAMESSKWIAKFAEITQKKKQLPHVKILATGGTIAGSAASNTSTTGYTAGALGVDILIDAVPEMKDIANVSGEQIANTGSPNVNNEILITLANRINELLSSDEVDGVVITHGTDTLEETAYFLNLTVKSDKPVVVVGAMRPATAISADGPMNLYNSVLLAGSKEATGRGVMVMLNDRIGSARYTTKTNTTATDTFKATEQGYIGAIVGGKPYFYSKITAKHTSESIFDVSGLKELPHVDIIYSYQNEGRHLYDAAVEAGAKGIVTAGSGNGSLSSIGSKALKDASEAGVVVVRSSRVGSGIVTPREQITSMSLNPQKARILLMLALTQTSDPEEIKQFFAEY